MKSKQCKKHEIRELRLQEARRLMLSESADAANAGFQLNGFVVTKPSSSVRFPAWISDASRGAAQVLLLLV
ncbi:hypothetical protein GC102_30295 [Paenibacillus sp. LMG 31460]|uniref:Uncharacterized protein n=1 Tax=Paenibacillus germinis TaxID=2654979 RepID=A0ABX1Z9H6_9BACL|nr:hypothetical protein [Paenibacillus germinis]